MSEDKNEKLVVFKAAHKIAADVGSSGGLARIKIVANTGAVMEFDGERIALDVEGVYPHDERGVPILYGHDFERGIGHSTSIRAEDGELIVDGVVSRETDIARDFVTSARNGFPWQASVMGYVRGFIELDDDESLELHGETIAGPAIIATSFELFEVSVVEYGADGRTSSEIAARRRFLTSINKDFTMDEEKKKVDATAAEDETAKLDAQAAAQEAIQARREAEAAELERVAEIKKRAQGNDEVLMATAIKEGWTPDKFELESLRASRQTAPAVHTPADEIDDKALEAAALRAAGFTPSEKRYNDKQLSAADKIGNLEFLEFAEMASHAQPFSYRKDGYKKVCAAISTSNLGSILSNVANAALLDTMAGLYTEWRRVFKLSAVNDYKAAYRYRLDSNFEFKEVPEGAELEHAVASDEQYTVQAKLWGRQFALSEQAIVNGEALGVFGELLRQVAYGANDAINKQAWSLLMNPANSADGVAFYHANHGSLKASSALTLDNLSAARAQFISRQRSKLEKDEPLGIPPRLLVVPTALEDKALMLTRATTLSGGSGAGVPTDWNPQLGRFEVVGVPFLEYATYTNYSSTTWYLFADPFRLAAFEICFLNGVEAPIIRQDQMRIGQLGIEFDAHFAFGVGQEDYRGALKCTA